MNFIKNLFNRKTFEQPHYDLYGNVPINIDYPDKAMYELLHEASLKYPNYYAIEYYGKNITYKKFYTKVEILARALKSIGVKENERVTICMPNTPEAIMMFYAVNMIGATSSMIHPLSSENEIEFYMDAAGSKYILTIDLFASKVINAATKVSASKVIVATISDSMYGVLKQALNIYDKATAYIQKKS